MVRVTIAFYDRARHAYTWSQMDMIAGMQKVLVSDSSAYIVFQRLRVVSGYRISH